MIGCRWRKSGPIHGCAVGECSGFLARITNDPDIIFADEPTGNIDSKTGDAIMDLLLGLARARKKTLLIVTHDNNLAQHGDRMLRIVDGLLALRSRQASRPLLDRERSSRCSH